MNAAPIGVFDSGVGGLTVFHALEQTLPDESLVYLGDTARVPYGTRSPQTVVRYSLEAARFLRDQGVKLLVVACNTASSVALEPMAGEVGLPVVGVIEPGARRAVELTRDGRIGVIGTRATIGSGAYTRAIERHRDDARVTGHACPLFVPLAEEGWTDNDVALRAAQRYLDPLRRAEVDVLVLGCTHYPLLRGTIAQVMGPDVELVDSAQAVAAEVHDLLHRQLTLAAEPSTPHPEHRFYVTDVPEPFQIVAERFLGRPLGRLERADIDVA